MSVAFRPAEVFDLAFAVESEEKNGTADVWLSGEFDLAGIPLFELEIERLQRHGCDLGVIDLTDLAFIDAVGLHAILAARERVSDSRPPPALVGATPPVSRVFELLGLERHLAERR